MGFLIDRYGKFNFDELLYNIEKQGYDLINADGSLYDIKEGA
jgi:hypothetical protein